MYQHRCQYVWHIINIKCPINVLASTLQVHLACQECVIMIWIAAHHHHHHWHLEDLLKHFKILLQVPSVVKKSPKKFKQFYSE